MAEELKITAINVSVQNVAPLITEIVGYVTGNDTLKNVYELAKREVMYLLNRDDISSEAKRKAAAAVVEQQMIELGTIVAKVLINLAVELAVAAARAQFAEKKH